MLRLTRQCRGTTGPRRAAALLLALVLNVTLVPCAMALQPADEAHDCCPPQLRLDAAECCVIDDVTLDARGARTAQAEDHGVDLQVAPAYATLGVAAPGCDPVATGPPGQPIRALPVYKLNCTYLK